MTGMARQALLLCVALRGAGASEGALRGNSSAVKAPVNGTDLAPFSAEGAQDTSASGRYYYWDGQCSPCPAYLYPRMHCGEGGQVAGERACRTTIAFCEAKCVKASPAPAPAPTPTPGPRPPAPAPGPAPGQTYWDGVCLPCPAHFYWRQHCPAGGRLINARGCGWHNIFCEGQCRRDGPAPGPSPTTATTTWVDYTSEEGVKTMYHETSPQTAEAILASSFRPGSSGWCGGAIYFSPTPRIPDSKLGPDSQRGAIIEAQVDLGKMRHLNSACLHADEARKCCDSVTFNPGDGEEFLVFSPDRVISMRRYS